jgi:hypothetical protein|tara:strand:- start:207 stop:443 length:237 start_codon:yes stop_codon:yes gene_type:complete
MTIFHQIFIKAFAEGKHTHDDSSKHDEWFQASCQTEEEFTSAEKIISDFAREQRFEARQGEHFIPKEGINWKHITINI